jgi:hypothetical protein
MHMYNSLFFHQWRRSPTAAIASAADSPNSKPASHARCPRLEGGLDRNNSSDGKITRCCKREKEITPCKHIVMV